MSKKKGSYFTLTENTKSKIKQVADENGFSNGQAIEMMVNIYFKDKEQEHKLLVETVSSLFDEKLNPLHELLNKIWVTGNVVDRDTKMMLEFWNHYFFATEPDTFVTTEKFKAPELTEAEKLIKGRIAHHRQRKLEWEDKRKNGTTS